MRPSEIERSLPETQHQQMEGQDIPGDPFELVELHRDPNAWKPGTKAMDDADDPMHAVRTI